MDNIQLEIKDHETILSSKYNGVIVLPIGLKSLNGFEFKHSPITPYEAELAIEHIENIIIPARKHFTADKISVSCSDHNLYIVQGNELKAGSLITTSNIESVFNELVNIINGSPAHLSSIPTNSLFSAFLLIIREITHHWMLDGITLA